MLSIQLAVVLLSAHAITQDRFGQLIPRKLLSTFREDMYSVNGAGAQNESTDLLDEVKHLLETSYLNRDLLSKIPWRSLRSSNASLQLVCELGFSLFLSIFFSPGSY
jgi:hypothetical protein